MTGLPFVWAFWAGRPVAADAETVGLLQAAAEAGLARTDDIADAYVGASLERRLVARQYLRDHIRFTFDARAQDGLRAYYAEAVAMGLAPDRPSLDFFPAPDSENARDAG
jgi:predicted solute-binding protein